MIVLLVIVELGNTVLHIKINKTLLSQKLYVEGTNSPLNSEFALVLGLS